MTREELFKSDRNEFTVDVGFSGEVLLPVTEIGFERMVVAACAFYDIPVDDDIRSIAAGVVHHIPSECPTISLQTLADILYKNVSNKLTWDIDQEIKKKRIELAKSQLVKDGEAGPKLEVVAPPIERL